MSILEPVIAKRHTTFFSQQDPEVEEDKVVPPEKVSVLETPIAKSHTTFYPQHQKSAFAQQDDVAAEAAPEVAAAETTEAPEYVAGPPTEKVSIIEPMSYERKSNYALPFMRTTFFNRDHAAKNRVMFAQEENAEDAMTKEDGAAAAAEKAEDQAVKEELTAEADDANKRAIGQWPNDVTEKTSVIEPRAYENRQNYALPYMRTTFFGQRN